MSADPLVELTEQCKTLRSAAQLLRQRAGTATSAHWWTPKTCIGPSWNQSDAEWVSMVNPGLADPLSEWLDSAAADAEQIGPDHRALAVARFLLGGQP